jgi:hypothetical protein
VAQKLAASLREKAVQPLDAAALEAWLGAQEAELLDALKADAGSAAVAAAEAAIEDELAPYRERMPARVLVQIRSDSLARRLLEAHGLMRLSLFHL